MTLSKRAQENLVAGVLLLVFVGFLVVGMGYGAKTRLVPVPIAIVSILLILGQTVLQNLRPDIKLSVDTMEMFAKVKDEDCGEEEGTKKSSMAAREWQGMGLIVLFVGMILVLGLIPAALVFVFGYFLLIGKEHWLKSLAVSGVSIGILYLLFVNLLGIHAYQGILGSMVGGVL